MDLIKFRIMYVIRILGERKRPLFRVLGLLASPAFIWVCWACGMRFLRYACISCVSFYVYDCTYAHMCVFHCGLLFDFAFSLKGAPSCAKLFPAPAPSFLHCGLGAVMSVASSACNLFCCFCIIMAVFVCRFAVRQRGNIRPEAFLRSTFKGFHWL